MSRLAKNIIYNLGGQGALLVLGFVAARYVFRRLGEDGLGIIYFTAALNVLLCGALEMGFCATTVREVSGHHRSEPAYVTDLLRTTSSFYWGAYLALAAALWAAAPLIVGKWINLSTLDPATATRALRILGIGSLVGLPRPFYASALRGLERMEFNNFIDPSVMALQQFGTIGILWRGGGLIHVAWWFAACYGLSILAYLVVCARFFSFRALLPGFSAGVLRRNFGYTSRMATISILSIVQAQADRGIVSKLLPLGVFGYYALAYSAVSRGALFTGSVAQAAFPSLSAAFKNGDRAELMSKYRRLQDFLCFATVPIFAAVPFAAVPVFTCLLNARVAHLLLLPATFLALGFYMNATLNMPYFFSLAVGKPEIAARTTWYALFVVLPVTGLLIYRFGLAGAGFSWVFYHLFAYAYQVPRTCSEFLGIPAWKWYIHVLRVLLLVALTYGTAWLTLGYLDRHSVVALAAAYVLASAAFLTVAYVTVDDGLKRNLQQLPFLRPQASTVFPL